VGGTVFVEHGIARGGGDEVPLQEKKVRVKDRENLCEGSGGCMRMQKARDMPRAACVYHFCARQAGGDGVDTEPAG